MLALLVRWLVPQPLGLEALRLLHVDRLEVQLPLALARLLLGPPDALWLLDEPNAGLDGPASVRLDDLISRHLDGGGMVIAATHLPLAPTHKGSDLVLADPQ